MCDVNMPFDIQFEIIRRLAVKLLIRFRSVCKTWKCFIDSPFFIAHQVRHSMHVPLLLVRYTDVVDSKLKFVSYVDDDDHTFPLQRVSVPVLRLLKSLESCFKVNISHGLLCMYGLDRITRRDKVVLWNLTIRKSVVVYVPKVRYDDLFSTSIGFGVRHGETIDPTIVRITHITDMCFIRNIDCIPRQVQVFTLSTGAWRRPYSSNLPRKSIEFTNQTIDVDGAIYWLAGDRRKDEDGKFRFYSMLISFDITSEEFNEVHFPDVLTRVPLFRLSLFKIRESLVVLNDCWDTKIVWMMEDGVPKVFTKIFTIIAPKYKLLKGFRNSSAPIVEVSAKNFDDAPIVEVSANSFDGHLVFEPYSKHIDNVWIKEIGFSSFVAPYMETLLLLDQPDLMVYNDIQRLRTKNKRL